jgi:hypothetical protein
MGLNRLACATGASEAFGLAPQADFLCGKAGNPALDEPGNPEFNAARCFSMTA